MCSSDLSPSGNDQWARSTISRVLHNEAYVGETRAWKYRRERSRVVIRPEEEQILLPSDTTPLIVGTEIWATVQAQLQRNKVTASRRMIHKEEYLLRGHVICGHCGYPMWGERSSRKERIEYAYRCRGKAGHMYSTCSKGDGLPWISARKLDEWVWNTIVEILTDPDLIEREAAKRRNRKSGVSGDNLPRSLMCELQKQETNVVAAIRQTESPRVQNRLMRELEDITAKIARHELELSRIALETAEKEASRVWLDEFGTLCKSVGAHIESIEARSPFKQESH